MSVLLYLALLPVSVWVLAGAFGLLDGDGSGALKRLLWRLLPLLGLAGLLGSAAAWPLLLALGTVLVLHIGSATALRFSLQRSLWHRVAEKRDRSRLGQERPP